MLAPLREVPDTAETAYRGEVELYDPPKLPASAERDLYLAVARVAEESNLDEGARRLAEAIARLKPEEGEFYFKLADGYWKKGDTEKPSRSTKRRYNASPTTFTTARLSATEKGKRGLV